jgi:hypothetical protein
MTEYPFAECLWHKERFVARIALMAPIHNVAKITLTKQNKTTLVNIVSLDRIIFSNSKESVSNLKFSAPLSYCGNGMDEVIK